MRGLNPKRLQFSVHLHVDVVDRAGMIRVGARRGVATRATGEEHRFRAGFLARELALACGDLDQASGMSSFFP
jgi:hypothetical protein